MIISEKIMSLRKQYGWSQEELADLVGVSRQSVSKWESAASMPDIQKIIKLSEVFGVSVDYLLKDEMDLPESSNVSSTADIGVENDSSTRTVSLEEANEYMDAIENHANKIAGAVALFILSPVSNLIAEAMGRANDGDVFERISIAIMVLLIGAGVALCVISGFAISKYEYLSKEQIKLGYGVEAAVKRKYEPFRQFMGQRIAGGVFLCIVGALPGILFDDGDKYTSGLAKISAPIMLIMVAAAVYMFVKVGIISGSYSKLLQEGDYTPEHKRVEQKMEPFAGIYWIAVAFIYLIPGFLLGYWNKTWVIWPVAGVIYGIIYKLYEMHLKRNHDK